ncbi:MAG: phosphoenolpyruvate--protein phosphotransferase [Treponema sp.]|jgi:phosphotransferase system enzyme I (PtsI)|nr:phosphoenolpyruvate--protein phosphotransferase [Treponema sp.]
MEQLSGIPASSGIVMGKAFLFLESDTPEIPRYLISDDSGAAALEAEWQRLLSAIEKTTLEIDGLQKRAAQELNKQQAEIFEAHKMMAEDPDFLDQIKDRLFAQKENVEWIVTRIVHEMTQKLNASGDAYLRERAVDITDVSNGIIRHLLSIKRFSLADLKEDVILVVQDLLPSDALTMNKTHVKGIVTDAGGRTSHTAILSRAFEIPAVLGLSNVTKVVHSGDTLIVDGGAGTVTVNPDEAAVSALNKATAQRAKTLDELAELRELPAETIDGHQVLLKANIETPEEAERTLKYGADGIGLYRSEFLFITPGMPSDEEAQYQAYSSVLKTMGDKPVTIRTLDVGGDKIFPNFKATDDKNSLLGWRAIRFCLSFPELFKTQLRAMLRASVDGNLRIMFPMISGVEELENALTILEEAKAECRKKKQKIAENIEVGIMIEVPSAAMTADILAKKSSFFSIGTNDLIQYSVAADRGNEKVNYLTQPFHPAVLRFIKTTIDAAHDAGIKAAMCGELAGDTSATAILLGLGLDEFSMTPQSIPLVKRILRGSSLKDCENFAAKVMECSSYHSVRSLVDAWMDEHFPVRCAEL